jgi:hypothetical protein
MRTETEVGAAPIVSAYVTLNATGVRTTAGFGETAAPVSRPVVAAAAVPTAMTSSRSASGDATSKLMGSLLRRRTVTPVMSARMGRAGGVGNGTAVMAPPRTLAPARPLEDPSPSPVEYIARHPEDP